MKYDCEKCQYYSNEGLAKECEECSNLIYASCSCHIQPPCNSCTNNKFEERKEDENTKA